MSLFLHVETHVSLKGEISLNVLSTCLLNIPVYVSPACANMDSQNPTALLTRWSAGFGLPNGDMRAG